MFHWKTYNSNSLEFRGKEGWSIGVALDHYQCQRIISHNTKADQNSDMVEFRHQTITTLVVAPEDRILHGFTMLTNSLTDALIAQSDDQL